MFETEIYPISAAAYTRGDTEVYVFLYVAMAY